MNFIQCFSYCRLILSAVKTKILYIKIKGFIQFPCKDNKISGGKTCCKAQPEPESELFVPAGIQPDKNKKQYGERPKRRTSIAKEWKWNTNYRNYSYRHSDVGHKMKKQNNGNRVAINS